jgi:hypothetical protein
LGAYDPRDGWATPGLKKEAYMSLQEFAWLGATMSGVGVIVSVIYVSIQISHNTRAVRAAAFQQVVNSFAAVAFDLARDKNLVDLFVRGGRDFTSLGEVERTQYSYMLLSFLRRAESVVFPTEIHMLHNHHWSGIRNSIKAVMAAPGTRICWSEIKNRLNPEFCDFIEELTAEQPKHRRGQTRAAIVGFHPLAFASRATKLAQLAKGLRQVAP